MKKSISKYIYGALLLLSGLLIGWFSKPSSHAPEVSSDSTAVVENKNEIWTCSMHPQIREDGPGKCPICGMDLIPLLQEEEAFITDPGEIRMSEAAIKIAEVQTSAVEKQIPYRKLFMPGKVKADERKIASITSRLSGRIEKLYITFTGEQVTKGQKLATIYSPQLVTAQKELFEAKKLEDSNPSFYQAARNKLKLWDISDKQIEEILQKGEPRYYFDVLAPQSGTVTKRIIAAGDYVKEGSDLFEIANLNFVWVTFDAYEIDLPWIKKGNKISFTVQSIPDQTFNSAVTFIDPVINPQTRTASVRTEIRNEGGKLKPEMFVSGILIASLPRKTEELIIPKTAVLWTGKRAIVYVKKPGSDHVFSYREIELGPETGSFYVVKSGLKENEEIVTNGVFKIDAAAQLQGKQSMMNPEGEELQANMPGMQMGAVENPEKMLEESSVDPRFQQQFTSAFNKYLDIKDALLTSDLAKTEESASLMKKELDKVDMKLAKGEMHVHWMEVLANFKEALSTMEKAESLENARIQFSQLSDITYKAVSMFGLTSKTIYYQFCPMANDNKGAFWLSQFEDIRNPYFPETMPTCGEVRETIKSK